eukprot:3509480-Prymnesium_polylepis.1
MVTAAHLHRSNISIHRIAVPYCILTEQGSCKYPEELVRTEEVLGRSLVEEQPELCAPLTKGACDPTAHRPAYPQTCSMRVHDPNWCKLASRCVSAQQNECLGDGSARPSGSKACKTGMVLARAAAEHAGELIKYLNFQGSDLRGLRSATPERCRRACQEDERCLAFTFIIVEGNRRPCWLKWRDYGRRPQLSRGTISGVLRPPATGQGPTAHAAARLPLRGTLYWMNLARRTDKRVRFERMLRRARLSDASKDDWLRVARVDALDGGGDAQTRGVAAHLRGSDR